MATIQSILETNLAQATENRNTAETMLANAGIGDDFIASVVATGYTVVVIKNPSTSKDDAELLALAESYGFELFTPPLS